MNPTELIAQRRQTRGYIEADPSSIVLTRNERVKTETGGWRDQETLLPAQTFKFLPASLAQQYTTPAVGGRATVSQDQLLGVWNADIKAGDTFTHEGEDYEVQEISRLSYRIIALLVSRSPRG